MTNCRPYLLFLIASAVLVFAAAPCLGELRPQEVVVVVNANAKGSVELGKYYCRVRNILPERLVALRTSADATISRREYNENIRDPLRLYLTKNKLRRQVRCIVLMWGVPVRVLGSKATSEQRKLTASYKTKMLRLLGRLAVNYKLLDTVALEFPAARTKTLRPVGRLFSAGAGARLDRPPKFEVLARKFSGRLKGKQAAAALLTDRKKRLIALRQIAALRLDTFGPADLLKNMPSEPIPGVPSPDQLKKQAAADRAELKRAETLPENPATAKKLIDLATRRYGLVIAHNYCKRRFRTVNPDWEDASVDSELSLLWEQVRVSGDNGTSGLYRPGPLHGARPNPMFWRLANMKIRPPNVPDGVIMTARIDGPTAADALRIIKDSIATEKTGLKGTFYIDAGGKYPYYDKHLKVLAAIVRKNTKIPVVLNTKKALFRPGSCPDAALYVGWYSLQNYIPAFKWVRGAVGWHIASLEAVHLRAPKVDEWCVKMIQNGVTVTAGAVSEPYLRAFPLPEDFFGLLLTGHLTVAECYWRTVPSVSWRLTFIGDPLYNPFRLHPQLSIYALPATLVGRPEIKPTTAPTTQAAENEEL